MAEMNGAVLKEKVGAFRVLPHHARYTPIQLPDNIHDLIDLSPRQLEKMIESSGDEETDELKDNEGNELSPDKNFDSGQDDYAFGNMPRGHADFEEDSSDEETE